MRYVALAIIIALTASAAEAKSSHTRGYVTRSGTYVAPSYHTAPNRTKLDNYSTKGNVNPYTGQMGTVNPYQQPSPYNPYQQ